MEEVFKLIVFGVLGLVAIAAIFYLGCIIFLRVKAYKYSRRRASLNEELDKLQILEWSDNLSFNDTCCQCCITFLPNARITIFPCQHSCHVSCAKDWITKGNLRCPMCNAEIIPNTAYFTDCVTSPPPSGRRSRRRSELEPLVIGPSPFTPRP